MHISDCSSDVCSSDLVDLYPYPFVGFVGFESLQSNGQLFFYFCNADTGTLDFEQDSENIVIAYTSYQRHLRTKHPVPQHLAKQRGQPECTLVGNLDRRSTRLNSSPSCAPRLPSPA